MRFLAISEGVEPYIEDSPAAVAAATVKEKPTIAYYEVLVDPDTMKPRLGPAVTHETFLKMTP